MSGSISFSSREAELVTLLAEGLTLAQVDERLGTTVSSRHLTNAKAKAGVSTVRALVYVSFAEGRIAPPAPITSEDQLSPLEELVWAGLRFDILDAQLPGALSSIARTTSSQVAGVLSDLRARHRTTYCGLIARGYALGLLSGCEGVRLPGASRPVSTLSGLSVPGLARTGPWNLTGRQSEVLALLPVTRSAGEAAAQMQISTSTYRNHLKTISNLVGVSCLRALTHRALQEGILRPPARTDHIIPGLASDLATVWRGLVLDVPDRHLQVEIAAASGLKGTAVLAALGELRAQGEADWQLVARGWATGVITANDPAGRLVPRGAARKSSASRGPDRSAQPEDRLRLLPLTSATRGTRPRKGTAASTVQDVHVGRDLDLVLVDPDVCRQLLAGLPPEQWGPVVGRVEARTAFLVTSPAVLPDGWRARYGRLWSRGSTVALPPDMHPAPDGAYWAVPRHAPRWDPARLEQLLDRLPPALTAAQHG
ncbi:MULTISPECIES: hypothetical protein [unclassified Streptomyces]|uniref:hypothetical protein n=1 Tax=unclassified Streptomyces TaxID=2593676 RepID=UPI0037AEAB1C